MSRSILGERLCGRGLRPRRRSPERIGGRREIGVGDASHIFQLSIRREFCRNYLFLATQFTFLARVNAVHSVIAVISI
jgi:hypothetical protein